VRSGISQVPFQLIEQSLQFIFFDQSSGDDLLPKQLHEDQQQLLLKIASMRRAGLVLFGA
jgi:hypothetical protein